VRQDNKHWIIQVNHWRSEGVWRKWTIGHRRSCSLKKHIDYLTSFPLLLDNHEWFSRRFYNTKTKEIIPFEVFGW